MASPFAAGTTAFQDPGIRIPVFTWRSVGASHSCFVVQAFIDELATLRDKDPLEVRQRMLERSSDPVAARHMAVLQDVAARADWGGMPPAGRARGFAIHQTFGTIVSQVAEVAHPLPADHHRRLADTEIDEGPGALAPSPPKTRTQQPSVC